MEVPKYVNLQRSHPPNIVIHILAELFLDSPW